MNQDKYISRQRGGLMLVALMIVFVFTNSWYNAKPADKNACSKHTFSAASVEQIVFRDSQSALKSLPDLTSKIQFFDNEFSSAIFDLPGLEIATCEALFIAQSLYKTFYTSILIHAP